MKDVGITTIKNMLEKMALMNQKRNNSSDLLDIIAIICNELDKQNSNELPLHIKQTKNYINFNFWTYYDEFKDFCDNRVIISKDLKKLYIERDYGQIHFYDNFEINNCAIKKKNAIVKTENMDNQNNYYQMSISR